MLELMSRAQKSPLLGPALAFAAVLGWGSFAYSALASREHVSTLTAERDAALASTAKLQEAAGELAEVESKLGSARVEYNRVTQSWAEAKTKSAATQQELATVTKRLDQAKDRVSQTGSVRQVEPPRRPAQKP
jgi:septal ring factor EnvC (AmiA/AmiB activator)